MDDRSARLALPLLAAGQAQKEVTHNEALGLLDLLVQPAVEAAGTNDPPGTPEPGACWIIGPAPTGAWAGQAGAIAGWTAGGWRFAPAVEGMAAWVRQDAEIARFSDGSWQVGTVTGSRLRIAGVAVVGPQAGAIAAPAGGATVDAEARAAIAALLSALRGHGLIAT